MESTHTLEKPPLFIPKEAIRAKDLIPTFNYYADKIKILSLDCFDTVLWRRAASPIDVFHNLQQKPTFRQFNFSAILRGQVETLARGLKVFQEKTSEVTLHEIYRAGFPQLSAAELSALAHEELQAEMETCYAFPPMVKLIREAHARGIKIIIVSNTYLQEFQLRRLLAHCLPPDVMGYIHHVFCSVDYHVAKNNGLFNHVLTRIGHTPQEILHIGDNADADFHAARNNGMYAAHFIQYDGIIQEQLRMYNAAASVFMEDMRHKKTLLAPFRGVLANIDMDKPEKMIGYASLGPVMYTFATFICNEIQQLTQQGKSVKPIFIMRDAHLPQLACEALLGQKIGHRTYLSRFSVYAASFYNRENINIYLLRISYTGRFDAIAKQLLLPDEIIGPLVALVKQAPNPISEFVNQMQSPQMQEVIFKQSALYRQRLITYLKKETDFQPSDTLMFIDLGYSGSAQRLLQPILEKEHNVEVIGRYLIQLDVPQWEKSRKGLMDPSWCDMRAMKSIVEYVALLEQICTSFDKSVVNYDDHGNPIFLDAELNAQQYQKMENLQNECLKFIKDAKIFFDETGNLPIESLREVALAELGRMLFLPTKQEVDYLESFQFDINLGTKDLVQVYDSKLGMDSLRKRGLFFQYMERNSKSMRTNSPAEMRSAGLELAMMLMAQARFAVELGYTDMSFRHQQIKISLMENFHPIVTHIEAMFTYDGFYAITLPISRSFSNIKILLGEHYQWVEIHSAEQFDKASYLYVTESLYANDCLSQLDLREMTNRGGKLYECSSTNSYIGLSTCAQDNQMLRIVFRPIVVR